MSTLLGKRPADSAADGAQLAAPAEGVEAQLPGSIDRCMTVASPPRKVRKVEIRAKDSKSSCHAVIDLGSPGATDSSEVPVNTDGGSLQGDAVACPDRASTSTQATEPDVQPSLEAEEWFFSGVPQSCQKNEDPNDTADSPPVIVGIDEAGRGCVLGPMVYGAAFWRKSQDEDISKAGYDDSKGLTAEVRERLFRAIKEKESHRIGYITVAIPATAISAKMLRRCPYSLNKMSHDCAINMVRRLVDEGVNIDCVYVDTVGDPVIYENYLKRVFQGRIDFVVRKKADSLFKVVSAASICAKQTRDSMLESWEHDAADMHVTTDGHVDVGSGYPGDPKTKQYLQDAHDRVFGFSTWVRHSWSTCKVINKEKGVNIDFGDDDEEEDASQTKLGAFFSTKGKPPAVKRAAFFKRRGMAMADVSTFSL